MIAAGTWPFRFFALIFVLTVVKASPPLALAIIASSAMFALGFLLYRNEKFPRFVMDVLDRLTLSGIMTNEASVTAFIDKKFLEV